MTSGQEVSQIVSRIYSGALLTNLCYLWGCVGWGEEHQSKQHNIWFSKQSSTDISVHQPIIICGGKVLTAFVSLQIPVLFPLRFLFPTFLFLFFLPLLNLLAFPIATCLLFQEIMGKNPSKKCKALYFTKNGKCEGMYMQAMQQHGY